MEKLIPSIILKITFTLFFIGLMQFCSAQVVWDGGGDQVSWNDAMNWNPDMVPPADSLVLFNMDATVTGTASEAPVRITISGSSTVVLDLDLTIGDGLTDDHAIVVNSKSTLILGDANNPTFNLNPSANKQGIAAFGSADSITININQGATLNILQGTNGINVANTNAWINNSGIINCESEVKNGIKTNAMVVNNGAINLDQLITDGIIMNAGSFDNNGAINITKPGEDCIEVLGDAVFSNFGTLDLVAKDSANSGNNAIAIGTDMMAGSFMNGSTGVINADGGDKDAGRAISINEMGAFTNMGLLTLTGGGDGSRLYNRGTSLNGMNGIMDLTDGRANINQGSFTNNGLIKSTRGGAGIFSNENTTLVNNAFFQYLNSGNFSSGMGTITDNGVSLNQGGQGVVDAAGSCTADIAEAPYEWSYQGSVLGTADDTGSFSFPNESVVADSAVLRTTIEDVKIKVTNICEAAVSPTSIFNLEKETIQLDIYPSLIIEQNELTIDLKELPAESVRLSVFNMNGQLVDQQVTYGGGTMILPVDNYEHGMYIVRVENQDINFIGKFLKTK